MSETSEPGAVERISAVLTLECRRRHEVGRLQIYRVDRWIEFWHVDSLQPESWTLSDSGMFSERCPGGCRREVGASKHHLVRRLLALADDHERNEETFTLMDVGSPEGW